MKKICKIMIIAFLIITMYANVFNVEAMSMDIWNEGNNFLNIGANMIEENPDLATMDNTSFRGLLDFLYGLGILVVFASTVVLGIKYMLVNPNEKSLIKQATKPYIIGVVIIFGAVTIWRLIIAIIDGSMGIGG